MRVTDSLEDVLYVRMLGGFSATWNNVLVAGGSKANESQFTYLLQILIHNREKGVTRDKLEQLLFEDREVSNIHHALQSIIYNAKKKLQKSGLPEANYIEQRKGVFYWTGEIPVVEDATEFDSLYSQAEAAENMDEKLALYMDACHWYGGEFLPAQTAIIWAARESRRYRERFCDCVEKAVQMLRANQDFFQMEELGTYASKIDPLADWETVTMEALASMGRYDDARKLYDETVQYYFAEQGLRPSKKLMEEFDRLGKKMKHTYAVLDEIHEELTGQNDMTPGGYLCTYPVFVGIYRMVERMLERGGQSVYLMLCTVVDGKGNPMKEGDNLEQLSKRMGDAVRKSVRRGDAMTQYGRGQYLVLLINTTREDCGVIQKRINQHFIVGRQRSGIQYYVNSVYWEPHVEKTDKNGRGKNGK